MRTRYRVLAMALNRMIDMIQFQDEQSALSSRSQNFLRVSGDKAGEVRPMMKQVIL
jgi:hypothetical protein